MTDEQIIEALGIGAASEEVQRTTVEGIRHVVELRVIGTVTNLMNDEQAAQFAELQAAGDDGAVWDWLRNDLVGVDMKEVYEAILKDYLDEKIAQLDEL